MRRQLGLRAKVGGGVPRRRRSEVLLETGCHRCRPWRWGWIPVEQCRVELMEV